MITAAALVSVGAMSKQPPKLSKKDLVCVAAVAGAHGVHGNIKVKSFTDVGADFASYGPLLDEHGEVLFVPKNARPVAKFFSLAVEKRRSREEIEALKSTKLFVPRSSLPEPEEDEFYHSDLIGMRVVDVEGESIGTIAAVHEFGAGDTLEIRPPSGPTFFHPFTLHSAPIVDMATRTVTVLIEEADEPPAPRNAVGDAGATRGETRH